MFAEPSAPHHRPHFHVYYQNNVAVYAIDPVQVLSGKLPKKQQRFVEAWAELHQGELMENWQRLQRGQTRFKIDPLR